MRLILILLLAAYFHPPILAQIEEDDEVIVAPDRQETKHQEKKMNTEKAPFGHRAPGLYLGGFISGGISNNQASFSISPEAGYFIVPKRLLGGLRFNYLFVRDFTYEDSYNIVGGGPFFRGYIWDGLFGQAEYEVTSILQDNVLNRSTYTYQRAATITNAVWIGGGYHSNFENGLGFYFAILYNVLRNDLIIYYPVNFRAGITYSF